MPDNSSERTEQATPKRREEARKKGDVAKSAEVNSALVLMSGTLLLAFTAHMFFGSIQEMMKGVFSNVTSFTISQQNLRSYALQTTFFLMKLLGPLFLTALVIGTAANVAQVGFLLTPEPLKPDLNKINPASGLKRIFSAKALAELLKGIFKITIIGIVIYVTIRGAASNFIPLMDQSLGQIASFLGTTVLKVALRAGGALLVLAAMDYGFQRWEYERSLRMSKQEVKEEMKEHEGDPLVKSRIRSIQRQVAYNRMMSEVPKADVVITNPIHYAVALRYVSGEMNAPVVVAKGARKIAEKIKEIALEHNIPIVENPPVARSLYKMCDVGMETPMELYKSVAEILAYVYQLKQKRVR